MYLSLPPDTSLSFIAYGSFKPFELRFHSIKEYVLKTEPIIISGMMREKDGIPIFESSTYFAFSYDAYLLYFVPGKEREAYQAIAETEPEAYYEWSELGGNTILVGKPDLKGTTEYLEPSWTFRNDPYFEYGLKACEFISKTPVNSTNGQAFSDYFPFFSSSSAYMLLWTIIERFCAIKYGNIGPSAKINSLVNDPMIDWKPILNKIERSDTIYRSDREDYYLILDKNAGPKKVLDYYYGMRSNMVHRGKDVFGDVDKIQHALKELEFIFKEILKIHDYDLIPPLISAQTRKLK